MIVYGEETARWVMSAIGSYTEGMTAIGWSVEGELVAGISFENWNGRNMFGHQRIDKSPPRSFWFAVADYIFNFVKVNRFTATVESTNLKAIKLNEHIGFITEATLRGAGKTDDLIIMTLWKDNCRMLSWGRK